MTDEIKKMGQQLGQLGKEMPKVMGSFVKFEQECAKGGVISAKMKELIALSISLVVRCNPCIIFHCAEAVKAGASRQEILEAAAVAKLMGGGPAIAYIATVLIPLLDELKVE